MSTELETNEVQDTNTVITEPAIKQERENKLPVVQQLLFLTAVLLFIFSGSITPRIIAFWGKHTDNQAQVSKSQEKNEEQKVTNITEPFSNIVITAHAAYVWDVQKQKALFKKNEAEKLPLASITKLMTALVAQEVLGEKDKVTIGKLSIRQQGESGFKEGEVFQRISLSDLVLMASSNDGAFALASAAGDVLTPKQNGADSFVRAMNIRAHEIGLTDTYFKNPTGLDLSTTEGGAYGTVRDVAFLMEYIVKNEPDILSFTKENSARFYTQTGEHHDAENTNEFTGKISGLIGSKTGYTELAGGNLVIAFNAGLNRPIIAAVLGSTQQERFSDILRLVTEVQKYIKKESQ